jgi:tRNA (guanosine-2'-O-)-methyltransferase
VPNDPKLAAEEMRRLTEARRTSYDPWWFTFDGAELTPHEVVDLLADHLSEERIARLESVLDQRTMSLVLVVEGMVDSGNIAAMMRTAEGFGVQSFHTIDTARRYKHSRRTSQGAEKWLDRWRWTSPTECVVDLRRQGLRIVAAHVDESAAPLGSVDFSPPTALVVGNELEGVSEEMLTLADETVMIPINGFVQSFNVSVATALCLDAARRDRTASLGSHGDVDHETRSRLRAIWYQKSVPHARDIILRKLQDRSSV